MYMLNMNTKFRTFRKMQISMGISLKKLEIFNPIVHFISIYVVNYILAIKGNIMIARINISMLLNIAFFITTWKPLFEYHYIALFINIFTSFPIIRFVRTMTSWRQIISFSKYSYSTNLNIKYFTNLFIRQFFIIKQVYKNIVVNFLSFWPSFNHILYDRKSYTYSQGATYTYA